MGGARSQHGESRPWQRSWGKGPDKCKGRIRPQGSPWTFSSIYSQNRSLPALLCYAFHLFFLHYKGLSPHQLFLEKVNLELLDNKSPGHNKSVSIPKPLWWLSSLPDSFVHDRFVQTLPAAHVIVYSLPTARGTGSLKHPKNIGASEESKSLE